MTVTMPRVVQTTSPNYTAEPIAHDLVIMHVMEGGCAGSVAWLCRPDAKASVHLCMNEAGDVVYQLVPLQFKAWGQRAFNGRGVSIELPGFTAQGLPDARWTAAAKIAAHLCLDYGIPPVWARGGQGRGVCQHVDLGAAGGGHHDCCGIGSPTWLAFMSYVEDAYAALVAGPLPPFALHGLPNPAQIAPPPAVAPEPSHDGVPRHEPGDVHDHPTTSTYPEGSLADVQHRLGIAADGVYGFETKQSLAKFQAMHGLTVDGVLGPKTWATLKAIGA